MQQLGDGQGVKGQAGAVRLAAAGAPGQEGGQRAHRDADGADRAGQRPTGGLFGDGESDRVHIGEGEPDDS